MKSFYSPEDIVPYPKATQRNEKSKRARGKTCIITNSPYKSELVNKTPKPKSTTMKAKKKLSLLPATISTSSKLQNSTPARKKCKTTEVPDSEDSENEDCICIFCNDAYSASNKGDGWVRCGAGCGDWAHDACAGLDEDDLEDYVCDYCRRSM